MNRSRKVKPLKAIIIVLFVLFVVLFVVNETSLFKNDKTHTFDEAFAKQMQGDALHTKSKGNQFVNASKQDIKAAMTVDHKDSDLMYMDLSEPIEMSEDEVNDMLKGNAF